MLNIDTWRYIDNFQEQMFWLLVEDMNQETEEKTTILGLKTDRYLKLFWFLLETVNESTIIEKHPREI